LYKAAAVVHQQPLLDMQKCLLVYALCTEMCRLHWLPYYAAGRLHLPALGRFHLPQVTPQQPQAWWKQQQPASSGGGLHTDAQQQLRPNSSHRKSQTVKNNSGGSDAVEETAQRHLLQQLNITGTNTALGSNTSSIDSSTNSSREVIKVCPAWAAEAATAGGLLQVGNGSNASIVSFSADFNLAEHGGVTAADRQAALAAAAAAAAEAAGSSLLSPGSNATEPPPVAFAPGLFDPLSVDEMLAG
jgi:hypothetical protein